MNSCLLVFMMVYAVLAYQVLIIQPSAKFLLYDD